MNQGTQTEDINYLIKQECQRYFYSQKENILSNIRIYARYDSEINFFLDKVLDELRKDFQEEKKLITSDLKDEYNNWKYLYQEELNKGIKKLQRSLDEKSKDIFKKEPYDLLTRNFMIKLKQEWRNEYEDKINNLYLVIIFLVFCQIAIYFYLKKN
jgi:hypothetical protein